MTRFRPCIDLHDGKVKQIVGGSLGADGHARENFVSDQSAAHFSAMYRRDGLSGGHVIQLGPGNEAAAAEALLAWPGGLQLGGGVTRDNAAAWLARGAEKVIVTSWLFSGDALSQERLDALSAVVPPEKLVIDLSCRAVDGEYFVATQRWQHITKVKLNRDLFQHLSNHASEFLIHAADVEGLKQGIDESLVELLGAVCPLPCTYAGGARSLEDLARVEELSGGRLDLTFGSALDIFGGDLVSYEACVAFNRRAPEAS
jgi:phosphoribosylformimino-5-aminoimidazole carboxamide ribotide isomerase